MKKLFLIAIILTSNKLCLAQPSKGLMFIGGGIKASITVKPINKYTIYTFEESKNTTFSVTPTFGYFTSNKMALGLYANTGYGNTEVIRSNTFNYSEIITKTTLTHFGGGLLMRNYWSISDKLYFTFNFAANYLIANSNEKTTSKAFSNNLIIVKDTSIAGKNYSYAASISPGLDYFITPHFGIRATFGALDYSYLKTDFEGYYNDSTNKGLELNFNTSTITFGLNYFFSCKKKDNLEE